MKQFFSGMGMGMAAGMFVGFTASMMSSDADKRRLRRKAGRAMKDFSSAAADLRELLH